MKRFKSKKVKKRKRGYLFLFVFFFTLSYIFMALYVSKNKINKNILDSKTNYINFTLPNFLSQKADEIVNKPVSLLNWKVKNASYTSVKKTNVSIKKDQIEEVMVKKNYEPLIYIYNTHQTESYVDYLITDAGLYLSEKLNQDGFSTYFEEQSVTTFLQANSMKYYKSYTVSRKYLNEAKEKYPSIVYYFDIHRDALKKEKSTITVNNKNYAKVMFIVGTDNKEFSNNLKNAQKLNEIINNMVPGITRGVIKKGGSGVNGVYNQDVSSNSFLIEVGGNNNTKEEVINTLDVIKKAIIEYVRGTIW